MTDRRLTPNDLVSSDRMRNALQWLYRHQGNLWFGRYPETGKDYVRVVVPLRVPENGVWEIEERSLAHGSIVETVVAMIEESAMRLHYE